MRNNNEQITETWKHVTALQGYNTRINYYAMVDENLAYVSGDQWRGVEANGLPTPVFNILKRTRDYKVSSIMSQKAKATYSVANINANTQDEVETQVLQLVDIMNNYMEIKAEQEKLDDKLRECLHDGFACGDYYIYTYWDAEYETGQMVKGDFCCEVIDGVNVLFGNPNSSKVEKQPFIIILGREMAENLKKEAKASGISEAEYSKIVPDINTEYTAGEFGKIEPDNKKDDSGKVTYAIKLWKENGSVYFTKSTRYCDIRTKIDLGLKRYPLCGSNWEKVKNNYRGRAEVTGMLPNQRYINKQFAVLMTWMMFNAMGKVAYDNTRIPSYSNAVGTAISVNGDVAGAIQQLQGGNFNSGVIQVVNLAMQETMNSLGINDVVMGNIKPDNTSAIIAVQKQSAVPLENQQSYLWSFIEDLYLVWGDFIVSKYTAERMLPQKIDNDIFYVPFNSELLREKLLNVKIDVGPSSMYSEIASMQTLDGLLKGGYITVEQYLKRIPEGIIPRKQELVEEIEQQMELAKSMQGGQMQGQEMQGNDKMAQYEQMAQIVEQLPPDMQDEFMSLSPDEQEMAIQEFMAQQGGVMNG